jgi:hypothetical protein
MAGPESNGQHPDPGIRLVLEELRDLRLEMRADRQHADEERRRADVERRQADAERRQADAERRQADADRRQADDERRRADEQWRLEWQQERRQADAERQRADEAWQQERRQADELWRQERVESNERFQELLREFREDSARREAATQKAFKDIRTVGLSIVKTLNHHTRILERIERKLGARDNGRRGHGNGRGA